MIKLKAALSKMSAADSEKWQTEHWPSVSRHQLAVACVLFRQKVPAERRSFTAGCVKKAFRPPRPTFDRAPPLTEVAC